MSSHEADGGSIIPKRPFLTVQQAVSLAKNLFHFKPADTSCAKEFNSYDDRCFYLKGNLGDEQLSNEEFVFKVLNYVDSTNSSLIEGYMSFMLFVTQKGFTCPAPIKPASSDKYYITCKLPWKSSMVNGYDYSITGSKQNIVDGIEVYNGQKYDENAECVCALWMVKYVPGKMLHEVPCTAQLLNKCGQYLARLHHTLKDFYHIGLKRPGLLWSIQNALSVKKYTHVLDKENHKKLVEDILNVFDSEVLTNVSALEKQVIHGDWNEHNIIISQDKNGENSISGFIDIADAHYTYRVFGVGVAMAYMFMLENINFSPVEAAGHFFAGYQAVFPVSENELSFLPRIVAVRFCQSLVFGAYTYKVLDPSNDYLLFTSEKWKTLQDFWKVPKKNYVQTWKGMCN